MIKIGETVIVKNTSAGFEIEVEILSISSFSDPTHTFEGKIIKIFKSGESHSGMFNINNNLLFGKRYGDDIELPTTTTQLSKLINKIYMEIKENG